VVALGNAANESTEGVVDTYEPERTAHLLGAVLSSDTQTLPNATAAASFVRAKREILGVVCATVRVPTVVYVSPSNEYSAVWVSSSVRASRSHTKSVPFVTVRLTVVGDPEVSWKITVLAFDTPFHATYKSGWLELDPTPIPASWFVADAEFRDKDNLTVTTKAATPGV